MTIKAQTSVKLEVQLLLDLRSVGEPVIIELDGSMPQVARQPFGELAGEIKQRAIDMAGENIFPLEATSLGVQIRRLSNAAA